MRLDAAWAAAFERGVRECDEQWRARLTHIKLLRTQERKIKNKAGGWAQPETQPENAA
jgi:hypothetical protein